MKRITLIAISICLCTAILAQQAKPVGQQSKEYFMLKSSKQKKAAIILLAGGGALVITGFALGYGSAADQLVSAIGSGENDETFTAAMVMFFTGVSAMAGSIPLFIAASKNRKKAMATSISLKLEGVPQVRHYSFQAQFYPAISFKLSL